MEIALDVQKESISNVQNTFVESSVLPYDVGCSFSELSIEEETKLKIIDTSVATGKFLKFFLRFGRVLITFYFLIYFWSFFPRFIKFLSDIM